MSKFPATKLKLLSGLIVVLSTLLGCSGEEVPTDSVYLDFKDERKIQLTGGQLALINMLDVNSDGHYDYQFMVQKPSGAFYIKIEGITSYLQENNPFYPVVQQDLEQPVRHVDLPLIWHMAALYHAGDAAVADENILNQAFLSKADEFETVAPVGDFYIPVVMVRGGDVHYGWVEVHLESNFVQVKRSAFCNTPSRKLAMGRL